MRNLTKIFFAVVAGMFAFSCVNDTIEDPTIEVGNSATTVITVSLEESKTQLGDKDAEGKYPLFWSAGDAIAINGVASQPLAETFDGLASASFNFDGEVVRPFSAVYPAPAEGITAAEGLYPVTFAATQAYTEGTFAAGAAPMYGYAEAAAEGEAELPLQLNHLTGVLRFAIKGDKALESIAITAEAPIAGNFDVNCQTGELTAHADASNTVTVTFGEGLALGAEATPIYVAVPAGEHGLYTIVINSTEGEAMVVKFNSDYHPVKVGVVKEFGEILFVPNATTAPEGELIITNEADMKKLGLWAENGMLAEVTSVKVAGNIDMSKISNWHPIVNFPAITFDGGSAEGYTISGLTVPLFEAVDGATIQNVKLTGVNIKETELMFVGSLVREAYNATINNCSAAGSLYYSYPNKLDGNESKDLQAVGGVIGIAKDTNISDCINEVSVKINQFYSGINKIGDVNKRYPAAGGIAGYVGGTANPASVDAIAYSIQNCTNLATIDCAHNDSTISGTVGVQLGGVTGRIQNVLAKNLVNGEQGTEKGNVTITKYAASPYWGGVTGWIHSCKAEDLTNYGPVTMSCQLAWSCCGGIVGSFSVGSADWSIAERLNNYGEIKTLEGTTASSTWVVGGIGGRSQSTIWTIKDSNNYGNITINCDLSGLTSDVSGIGGVFGECNMKAVDNCYNYGDVSVTSTKPMALALPVGGFIGVIPGAVTITNSGCKKAPGAVKNPTVTFTTETISTDSEGAATTVNYCLGGAIGYVKSAKTIITNCVNYADVIGNSTTISGTIYTGGFVGICKGSTAKIDKCENHGSITLDMVGKGTTAIGGFVGNLSSTTITNNKNCATGDIVLRGTIAGNTAVAGFAAQCGNHSNNSNEGDIDVYATSTGGTIYIMGTTWSGDKTISNFTNRGNFTFHGKVLKSSKYLFMSGCDYCQSVKLSNCHNYGTLKAESTAEIAGSVHMGGVSRCAKAKDANTTYTYENCSNSGDVIFNGTAAGDVYLAGCIGNTETCAGVTVNGTLTNSGNVSFGGSAKNLYIGGIVANAAFAYTFGGDIKNTGNISTTGTTTGAVETAGCFANSANGDVTLTFNGNVINEGTIYCGENHTGTGSYQVGGVFGYLKNKVALADGKEIKNSGNIYNYAIIPGTETKQYNKAGGNFHVGGVIARRVTRPTPANLRNVGNICIRNTEGCHTKELYIGGLVATSTQQITNSSVDCDIQAIGFVESADLKIGIGMAHGEARGSVKATGCKIGGRYALTETDGQPNWITLSPTLFVEEDANGEKIPVQGFAPYWTRIYGITWADADEGNCDNCTYESANPAVQPETNN